MILFVVFLFLIINGTIGSTSFDGPLVVFGVCDAAPTCAPAPAGQRYVPQDSLSDPSFCRLYPCGVLVPSDPVCPPVNCAPLEAPCRYRPNDAVNTTSGCPLFPCGTLDCDCVTTPVCGSLPHASCQLHLSDDLDDFGCPLHPCGVAVCPPSVQSQLCPAPATPCPTTGASTRCTAEQRRAKTASGCDQFPCCDRQCPVCQNVQMMACPRVEADERDEFGCRVRPCCAELAPCRRHECRAPPIVCNDADRTETYPIDCLVRPCCVSAAAPAPPLQCPQAGCQRVSPLHAAGARRRRRRRLSDQSLLRAAHPIVSSAMASARSSPSARRTAWHASTPTAVASSHVV